MPPLRDVIRAYELGARKALGQHFLLDLNVTRRIAREAGIAAGTTVIEVGPGPGGLTRALLDTSAERVIAVERDRRCIAALQPLVEAAEGRLEVIEGDALSIDEVAIAPLPPRAIVSNLPYNIAAPLLLKWLRRIGDFASLTLMFQKEMADRLIAAPGRREYGRLSVVTQWLTEVDAVLNLPARAFTPPPKVDSTVVRLVPRIDSTIVRFETMERVTAAAFGQRRKMLRQSLKSLGPVEPLLAAAGLEPTLRAEDVPVAGYVRLASALS